MDKQFDVIIIGSGAGGGTLARHLAPSGKSILILERGDWLKREALNWNATAVFPENRYVSPDTWYDRNGRPFQPQVHYFVGGATKMFGAALFRLRREDFGEVRHYDGISPAWPITYEELEPYYTKAEQMYHVHGLRGQDPTEPPASGPYPCPPLSHEPRIQQLLRRYCRGRLPSIPGAQRDHAGREQHGVQHLHPVPNLRWLSLPGARQIRCRSYCGATGPRVPQCRLSFAMRRHSDSKLILPALPSHQW